MKLLVLLVLLFAPVAHAALACPEINLESAPNSPFRQIPMYDQDGATICYAYAAAQIADYYLIQSGQKKAGLVNPMYAAWLDAYKSRFISFDPMKGNDPSAVLDELKSDGFCSNTEIERRLAGVRKATGLSDSQLLDFIDASYESYENSRSYFGFGRPAENWRNDARSRTQKDIRQCDFKKASLWQQSHGLVGVSLNKTLEQLFANCTSIKPRLPSMRTIKKGPDDAFGDEINRNLKNRQPLAIAIACYNSFQSDSDHSRPLKGSTFYGRAGGMNFNGCQLPGDAQHAMVVAGQKVINGECTILLRSSQGSMFRGEASEACACITKQGQYKDACIEQEATEFVGWLVQTIERFAKHDRADDL